MVQTRSRYQLSSMEREKGVSIGHDCAGTSTKREEEEEGDGELLGIKLRKGTSLSKRGGLLTPIPSWKMDEAGPSTIHSSKSKPSARKLGASLWEVQDLLPLSNMSRRKTKPHHFHNLSDASEPNSPIWPQGATRLTRRIGKSFDPHYKLSERTNGDAKLESPASYISSVKVSSPNQSITPSSSFDLKGRPGESGYSIKTSSELLKVLNRIWSLEEELASNVSLVKTLKVELQQAHSHIKKLTQEKQAYRYEMDDLMKRVSEDRITRKNKEGDRIKAAVQSIKNELEDESNLRRQSESLRRQLGKELSEMNTVVNDTLNDLKNERKARLFLEDLCDEFAKGLQEYAQEIENLKQSFGKHSNHRFDESLHHISEVWMEGRLQIKIAEAHGEEIEKSKIQGRLNSEIAAFFGTRRFYSSRNNGVFQKDEKYSSLRRYSVESVPLNGAASAPQDAEDDDSIISDFHCFELKADAKDNVSQTHLKQNDEDGTESLEVKSRATSRNEKLKCAEKIEGETCSLKQDTSTNEKLKCAENIEGETCSLKQDRSELCNGNKIHLIDSSRGNSTHTGTEECKVKQVHNDSCSHFSTSSHVTPSGKVNALGSGPSNDSRLNCQHASSDLDISKRSSRPQSVKENSLKEKLLEARLEGKNARLRALKGSSVGVQ